MALIPCSSLSKSEGRRKRPQNTQRCLLLRPTFRFLVSQDSLSSAFSLSSISDISINGRDESRVRGSLRQRRCSEGKGSLEYGVP